MPDRDALIKDDDDDDENDCEQSDLVSILLNMGYIPEAVIKKFNFESGFNKTFKPNMDAHLEKYGRPGSRSNSKENSAFTDADKFSPYKVAVQNKDVVGAANALFAKFSKSFLPK